MNDKVISLIAWILLCNSIISLQVTNDNSNPLLHERDIVASDNIIKTTGSDSQRINSWPMKGHDPQQTSYSTAFGPAEPDVIWARDGLNFNSFSDCAPVIDGKIYVGTADSEILCLDADTDEILNSNVSTGYTTGIDIYAVVDGKIYGRSNDFFCFDAETLEKVWDGAIGNYNIVITDNVIYAGDIATIRRYDALDGSDLGYFFGRGLNGLAVDNGYLYTYGWFNQSEVHCLDASDGTLVWSYTTGEDLSKPIAVSDERVFFAGSDGLFYCFDADPSDGVDEGFDDPASAGYDLIWTFSIPGSANKGLAVGNGMVYFTHHFNTLCCLDAEGNGNGTTTQIWNATDINQDSEIMIAGDKLYAVIREFSATPYHLGCFDATTGELIFDYTPDNTKERYPTSVSEGKVYVWTMASSGQWILQCFRDNSEPEIPDVPDGPTEGLPNIEYTFTTSATDPDEDDIYYLFDFGDGTNSSWIESDRTTHVWNEEGIYAIKVKAKDIYGAESDWSDSLIVTITPPLPKLHINYQSSVMENENFTITITSDGEPIEDVNVEFNGDINTTNSSGQVNFTAPEVSAPETYTITASSEGYEEDSATITVLDKKEKHGWIWGYVRDSDGDAIEKANVCVKIIDENNIINSECTFSDENGIYSKSVPVGTHTAEASKSGYIPSTQSVTIIENIALEIDFTLEESGEEPGPDEVQDAIQKGLVAAAIDEDGSVIKYSNVNVSVNEVGTVGSKKEIISVNVASEEIEFTTFAFYLSPDLDLDKIFVEIDGIEIPLLDKDIVFDLENSEVGYTIIPTRDGEVLFVKAKLSEHTITIYQIIETLGGITAVILYTAISVVAVTVFSSRVFTHPVYLNYFRKRKGR